jgi:hypothetical protein
MFKIIGVYRGEKEVLDSFETRDEAEAMLTEYRLAYGSSWHIYIRS